MPEETPGSSRQSASDGQTPQSVPAPSWLAWTAGGLGLAIALVVILFSGIGPGSSGTSAVTPAIDSSTAALLQLNLLSSQKTSAPGLTLTDQHGNPLSLTQFAGKSVVLTFNDDQCQDLCTLLAQDVIVANRDLGAAAKNVVFLSINANPYYPDVAAVKAWTDAHGLGQASNWYFGTGTPAQLAAVWKSYGVAVQLDATNQTVSHGAEIFFIDPHGREVALGQFGTKSANTALFGHAMAQLAVNMLPVGQRVKLAGSSAAPPANTGTGLGATPPPVVLPRIDTTGISSTSSYRGRYLVLNFWSSSCTACVREMPSLEQVSRDLAATTSVIGIDVSDDPAAARAFAKRAATTYPLLADSSGAVAGQYRISGLPYTVILNPQGKVLIRHPGVFTTEQLDYVIRAFAATGQ